MRKDKARSTCFIQGIQYPVTARKMVLPLDHSICIKPILCGFQTCLSLSWAAEVFPCFGHDNNFLITDLSLNLPLCNSVTTMYISKV